MTFNVENLFDGVDDPGKADMEFLPLSQKKNPEIQKQCNEFKQEKWRQSCLKTDWNEALLKRKFTRLSQVIKSVNGGRGPDILVLVEVENERVLSRLNSEYLNGLGYRTKVLIEGQDARGIDQAVLSRLPLAADGPKLYPLAIQHELEDGREKYQRGILHVPLVLPNKKNIHIYALHFPAPYHPTVLRKQGFRELARLASAVGKGEINVAAGDFNVTNVEEKKERLFGRLAQNYWRVAQLEGCQSCKGTSYYTPDKSWSFLDSILFSPELIKGFKGWVVNKSSIRVVAEVSEQKTASGTPKDFSYPDFSGVSDHFPMALALDPL